MELKNQLGDSDRQILVKFVEQKHVDSILNGDFYFSKSKHFIELEEEEKTEGIADKHEGSWSRILDESQQIILEANGETLYLPSNNAVLRESYSGITQLPICCFVFLSLKSDFEIIPNTDKIKLKEKIDLELRNQFTGRNMIVISDIAKLFDLFDKSMSLMDYPFTRNLVTYYDGKINPHPLTEEEYNVNPVLALLYKEKRFEHQKEYRFIIRKVLDKDVIIKLGDIKHMAADLGVVEVEKGLPIEFTFQV